MSNMRTRSLTGLLPSRTAEQALTILLQDAERWWYLHELARHMDRPPSGLRKALSTLASFGILRTRRDGNRVYYSPDPECPILPELRGVIQKTVGLLGMLQSALQPHSADIRVAFVYGSIASGSEVSGSDIDLLLVGSIKSFDVAGPLHRASEQLGRTINSTTYALPEFQRRIADGNHFLRSLLDKPRLFVVGTEHDLASITRAEAPRSRTDKPTGNRGPARSRAAKSAGRPHS